MADTTRARAALGMDTGQVDEHAQISPVDRRIAKTRTMEAAFVDAMPRGMEAKMLVRDAITALRNVPQLADTTEQSFWGALMTAAQLGLRPNVASIGHGWVLPYKNYKTGRTDAQWILGYQGMVELAYRSKLVESIDAQTIFEGEQYEYVRGTEPYLWHVPDLDLAANARPIAHYATCKLLSGGVIFHVIPDGHAQQIKQRSKAKDRQGNTVGPWKDDYLPMARKTALRGLWRFMPKSPAMSLALTTDEVTREGLDLDPALDNDESAAPMPDAPIITVQVSRVDAEPEPAAPEYEPAASDVRQPVKTSKLREALLREINGKHVESALAAAELVTGELILDLETLSTDELKAVLAVDVETLREFMLGDTGPDEPPTDVEE